MRSILPSSVVTVLRPVIRIVAAATVAEADVEKAIRPEREVAAVVVRERLLDDPRPALVHTADRSGWPDRPRRPGRPPEPCDHGVAVQVGEVHEEPAAGRQSPARARGRAGRARRRAAMAPRRSRKRLGEHAIAHDTDPAAPARPRRTPSDRSDRPRRPPGLCRPLVKPSMWRPVACCDHAATAASSTMAVTRRGFMGGL